MQISVFNPQPCQWRAISKDFTGIYKIELLNSDIIFPKFRKQ